MVELQPAAKPPSWLPEGAAVVARPEGAAAVARPEVLRVVAPEGAAVVARPEARREASRREAAWEASREAAMVRREAAAVLPMMTMASVQCWSLVQMTMAQARWQATPCWLLVAVQVVAVQVAVPLVGGPLREVAMVM